MVQWKHLSALTFCFIRNLNPNVKTVAMILALVLIWQNRSMPLPLAWVEKLHSWSLHNLTLKPNLRVILQYRLGCLPNLYLTNISLVYISLYSLVYFEFDNLFCFEVRWAMTRTRQIVGTTTAKWLMLTWWQQRCPGPTAEMTETNQDRSRATLGALARLTLHQVDSLENFMLTSIVSLRFNARESKKCSKLLLQTTERLSLFSLAYWSEKQSSNHVPILNGTGSRNIHVHLL